MMSSLTYTSLVRGSEERGNEERRVKGGYRRKGVPGRPSSL